MTPLVKTILLIVGIVAIIAVAVLGGIYFFVLWDCIEDLFKKHKK